MFVEVDHDASEFANTELRDKLNADWADEAHELFSDGSANSLNNPNGENGVRLHFDVKNTAGANEPGNPAMLFDGGGSGLTDGGATCDGGQYATRRTDSMNSIRQEWFRYWCATESGGGQSHGVPGLAYASGAEKAGISSHELGHNLGLQHGGFEGLNGKPNYISLMNYAFQTEGRLKGDRSLQFSNGNLPIINDTNLCEQGGLGPFVPVDHLDKSLGALHSLKVDNTNGYVDWNRDGTFSSCSNPVRAATTWATWAGTKAQTVGMDTRHTNGGVLSNAPTLSRIDVDGTSYLHVFYPVGDSNDSMRYRFTSFPGDCPNPTHLTNGNCGNWSNDHSTGWFGEAVTAETFTLDNSDSAIYLAVRQPSSYNDALWIFRGIVASNGTISFSVDKQFPSNSVVGTPDIEADSGNLYVTWRENNNGQDKLYYATMDGSGNWSAAMNVAGGSTHWTSNVSPTLATNPDNGLLYLLRTDNNDHLDFLYLSGSSWAASGSYDLPALSSYTTQKKPSLAWHPFDMVNDPSGAGFWEIPFEKKQFR